jgi:hypothetical protein
MGTKEFLAMSQPARSQRVPLNPGMISPKKLCPTVLL